eukprot:Rhum_TRINITY_DN2277_c0_g1::Rhum_TRINITY_DN2277_c0_g1_i1::g.6620::m.6620
MTTSSPSHVALLLFLASATSASGLPPPSKFVDTHKDLAYFEGDDIMFVPPMFRYTQADEPRVYIGSDPGDCSVKDPEGNMADEPTPAGYMEVQFSLKEAQLLKIELLVHTPDSMSDSFWGSLSGGLKQRWMAPRFAGWGNATYAPHIGDSQQFCHALPRGNHSLRLLIREPGAAVAKIAVNPAAHIASPAQQEGCSGMCLREGGSNARFTLKGMCGPATLDLMSVTIGGRKCTSLAIVDDTTLTCVSPPYDGDADDAPVVVRQADHATSFTVPYQKKPADNSGVIIGVSVASGTIGAIVCVLVCGALWNRHQQKRQMEKLYGASTLAAEMAEAIAVLDFDALKKLDNLQHPDRVQSAMKNILCNMKEFVKYIPHNVVQTVRGTSEDDGELASQHPPRDDQGIVPGDKSFQSNDLAGHSLSISIGRWMGAVTSDSSAAVSGAGSSPSSEQPSAQATVQHTRTQAVAVMAAAGGPTATPGSSGVRIQTTTMVRRADISMVHPLKNAMAKAKEGDGQRNVAAMVVRPLLVRDSQGDIHVDAESHDSLLNHLYVVMENTRGCIHRVCEDSVVAVWGATGSAYSTNRLLRAMSSVSEKGYHSGVYNQNSRCVYVGNNSMQSFCVLGGAVEEADTLSRLAVACGAPSISKAALMVGSSFTGFLIAPFFTVTSATAGREGRPVETAVLIGVLEAVNKEWMYEMEYRESRSGVETVLDGLFEKRDRQLAVTRMEKHKAWLGERNARLTPLARWLCRFLDATAGAPGDDAEDGMAALVAGFTPPVLEITTAGTLMTADSHSLPFVEPTQLTTSSTHGRVPGVPDDYSR